MSKTKDESTKVFSLVIHLEKFYQNKPSSSAQSQIAAIADDAVKRSPGWSVATPPIKSHLSHDSGSFKYICNGTIIIDRNISSTDNPESLHRRAERIIGDAIRASENKSRDWKVVRAAGTGGVDFDIDDARNAQLYCGDIPTAEIVLPPKWESSFKDDIYGLEPQIRIAWDALTSFVRSGYKKRSHVCFHGQAGCGKTTVCERLSDMIGAISPEGSILKLTASQMTKAGLENYLINVNPRPSLIFVEELDKGIEENLTMFLDICNVDGRIKKTNAVIGNVNQPISALVFCTVNNVPKFKRFLSGALASRFAHKLFFPRPSRDVLKMIALREVRSNNGEERWVDKALEILENEDSNDPRRLLAILDGGKRLMDGSYKKDVETMRKLLFAESEELLKIEKGRKILHSSLDLEDSF